LRTGMTRDGIKDLILEIIEDIDEDAEFDDLDADAPLRDQLDLDSMDFLDTSWSFVNDISCRSLRKSIQSSPPSPVASII